MVLPADVLIASMLYGAFIGMTIAIILGVLIPALRKSIIQSHKQGSKASERFAQRLTRRQGDDTGAPAPIVRHRACPNCGSKRYRFAASTSPWADSGFFASLQMKDRACKGCGTEYCGVFPPAARYFFLIVGLPIAVAGVAIVLFTGEILASFMATLAGFFIFTMGMALPRK